MQHLMQMKQVDDVLHDLVQAILLNGNHNRAVVRLACGLRAGQVQVHRAFGVAHPQEDLFRAFGNFLDAVIVEQVDHFILTDEFHLAVSRRVRAVVVTKATRLQYRKCATNVPQKRPVKQAAIALRGTCMRQVRRVVWESSA